MSPKMTRVIQAMASSHSNSVLLEHCELPRGFFSPLIAPTLVHRRTKLKRLAIIRSCRPESFVRVMSGLHATPKSYPFRQISNISTSQSLSLHLPCFSLQHHPRYLLRQSGLFPSISFCCSSSSSSSTSRALVHADCVEPHRPVAGCVLYSILFSPAWVFTGDCLSSFEKLLLAWSDRLVLLAISAAVLLKLYQSFLDRAERRKQS